MLLVCGERNNTVTDHGGEELATEPRATARADRLFDNGNINIRILAEFVRTGKSGGSSPDDDDISVSMRDHVGHVAARHLTRHNRLLDRLEPEGGQVVGWRGSSGGQRRARSVEAANGGSMGGFGGEE